MPRQLKEKTDIKLFILEMLKQINIPVDLVTLNSIVIQDGFVNGFDFMDCFYELSSSDCIEKILDEEKEKYKITDIGIRVCAGIDSPIVTTIKAHATRSALLLLSFQNRKVKTSSSIKTLNNGKYLLSCVANDEKGEIMNISLTFDNYNKADLFKDNYDKQPEFIYRGLLGLLSGDVNYLSDPYSNEDETDDEVE